MKTWRLCLCQPSSSVRTGSSHHFGWRREERCRSGRPWKAAVWNQTFLGAEAGANSTNVCKYLCTLLLESIALPSQEFWGCQLYELLQCRRALGIAVRLFQLSYIWRIQWGSPVFAQVLCWISTLSSRCRAESAGRVRVNEKSRVYQVGYLCSCWKVLDVPLDDRVEEKGWWRFCWWISCSYAHKAEGADLAQRVLVVLSP